MLIGETRGHLGCSAYLRETAGREDGLPPPVDLAAELLEMKPSTLASKMKVLGIKKPL